MLAQTLCWHWRLTGTTDRALAIQIDGRVWRRARYIRHTMALLGHVVLQIGAEDADTTANPDLGNVALINEAANGHCDDTKLGGGLDIGQKKGA